MDEPLQRLLEERLRDCGDVLPKFQETPLDKPLIAWIGLNPARVFTKDVCEQIADSVSTPFDSNNFVRPRMHHETMPLRYALEIPEPCGIRYRQIIEMAWWDTVNDWHPDFEASPYTERQAPSCPGIPQSVSDLHERQTNSRWVAFRALDCTLRLRSEPALEIGGWVSQLATHYLLWFENRAEKRPLWEQGTDLRTTILDVEQHACPITRMGGGEDYGYESLARLCTFLLDRLTEGVALKDAPDAQTSAAEPAQRKEKRAWLGLALAHLSKHPDWTDREIAGKAGVHPSTLSRNVVYRKARSRSGVGGRERPTDIDYTDPADSIEE